MTALSSLSALNEFDLNTLVAFDALVEAGSFTGAAARLGVPKAKVSLQIGRLEQRLGLALFTRTTRKVALTDAGRLLHEQCQPLLHSLQAALAQAGEGQEALTGTLRVSTSVDHAQQWTAPALAAFSAEHPGLSIDLRTSDRVQDLVGEGIDVAIRMGWLRDSSLRAVKLGEFEQVLVAAPAYLARAGTPRQPDDLARHDWVALTLLPTPLTWKLTAHGSTHTVHMRARLRTDSPGSLRAMLRAGAGISALDAYSARDELASGRLVRVLADWSLPKGGIYAVTPPGRHTLAKVRRFIDFYRDTLAGAQPAA